MLALTHTRPRGLQSFGAAAVETHNVLGVPFSWRRQIAFGMTFQVPTEDKKIIPKNRVPVQLASAIDQLLAKAVAAKLKAKPELATNPKELLAQAKASNIYQNILSGYATIGRVSKIGGLPTLGYAVLFRDLGSSYQIKLFHKTSSALDSLVDVVTYPLKFTHNIISGAVDLLKDGVEAALKLLEQLFKMFCKIAQSDAARFAQTIGTKYAGSQTLAADLTTSFMIGDKAQLTKTITDVYAGGNATKIAAANEVLSKVQGLCGALDKAPKPDPEKKKSRWPLVVGVTAGAAVLGGAGWLAFGSKRRRGR